MKVWRGAEAQPRKGLVESVGLDCSERESSKRKRWQPGKPRHSNKKGYSIGAGGGVNGSGNSRVKEVGGALYSYRNSLGCPGFKQKKDTKTFGTQDALWEVRG